jgi:hypothetical protein
MYHDESALEASPSVGGTGAAAAVVAEQVVARQAVEDVTGVWRGVGRGLC